MFFAKDVYGQQQLKNAFETLPIESAHRLKATARFFDVTENTFSRWLTGKANPPRAVCYALWHESPIGRAVTAAHSEQGTVYAERLARSLTDENDRLKLVIATLQTELQAAKMNHATPLAMNEPQYRIS